MIRLTKEVVAKLLVENEGFSKTVSSSGRNIKSSRDYLIQGGKLLIREYGKTSWADSKFDTTYEATADQVRRFLKTYVLDKK